MGGRSRDFGEPPRRRDVETVSGVQREGSGKRIPDPSSLRAARRLTVSPSVCILLPMPQQVASLADTLAEIVGPRHVRTALPERVTYAKDGLPTHRRVPGVVVLPGSRDEVIAVVRLLGALGMPFVPRGAGTGLSGGALADGDAVLMVLTRLNRILAIDPVNRLRGGGARRGARASPRRGGAPRSAIQPRSVEPDRLHHRRERGRERGRATLPQVRGDRRTRPPTPGSARPRAERR